MISSKRIFLTLALLSLLSYPVDRIVAQSMDSSLAYFPMHIGDIWEYNGYMISTTPYYSLYIEITGDTVVQNGLKYFIFHERNTSTGSTLYWKRLDSLSGSIYRRLPTDTTEIQDDSLRADPSDYFNKNTNYQKICGNPKVDTVFGVLTPVKTFGSFAGGPNYDLAFGFGLYYWTYDDGQSLGLEVRKIAYAKIAGVAYGTPLSAPSAVAGPTQYALYQNFPNPFNPSTTIEYFLPKASSVKITILNLIGQVVSEWTYANKPAGHYSVTWSPDVPSGVYIYRLNALTNDRSAERYTTTRKMILVK